MIALLYVFMCRWEIHATIFFLILNYVDQTEYVLNFEVDFLVLVTTSCS